MLYSLVWIIIPMKIVVIIGIICYLNYLNVLGYGEMPKKPTKLILEYISCNFFYF